MNSENQEVIYCPEDDEYRVYCDVCDKLCIERFYKNHLKSQTHLNNIRKIENSYFFNSISNPTERNNNHTGFVLLQGILIYKCI